MGNTLYLECSAGISGDMTVAALLDVGASEARLREVLASLPLEGYSVAVSRVAKSGIDACDFAVLLDEAHENHDHDMAFLHGHDHGDDRKDDQGHDHGDRHGQGGATAAHVHRGLADVEAIINAATMSESARAGALRVFGILADAEAKAHGTTRDKVHFHEVGAVDSIVDIVSAAVCFDDLGIEEVVVERVCEGRGSVRCAHGVLPVPVPAVANIVADHKIPLHVGKVEGELVTPTGAALVAAYATSHELPDTFAVRRIGYGAGKREYATSGLLRAMLID